MPLALRSQIRPGPRILSEVAGRTISDVSHSPSNGRPCLALLWCAKVKRDTQLSVALLCGILCWSIQLRIMCNVVPSNMQTVSSICFGWGFICRSLFTGHTPCVTPVVQLLIMARTVHFRIGVFVFTGV
jgi:hypothetical protein